MIRPCTRVVLNDKYISYTRRERPRGLGRHDRARRPRVYPAPEMCMRNSETLCILFYYVSLFFIYDDYDIYGEGAGYNLWAFRNFQ